MCGRSFTKSCDRRFASFVAGRNAVLAVLDLPVVTCVLVGFVVGDKVVGALATTENRFGCIRRQESLDTTLWMSTGVHSVLPDEPLVSKAGIIRCWLVVLAGLAAVPVTSEISRCCRSFSPSLGSANHSCGKVASRSKTALPEWVSLKSGSHGMKPLERLDKASLSRVWLRASTVVGNPR